MSRPTISLLFIEDDAVDRMAFERFVREQDLPYDYRVACSVTEAMEFLTSRHFDVVVTDHMLSDGDAFDVLGMSVDAPHIVVTGTGDEELAVRAMKSGAYDYVSKDPAGNYLKTIPVTVEKALRRKGEEEELAGYRNRLEELVNKRTMELRNEVGERTRAESALQKSEEKYRLLVDNAQDCIFIVQDDRIKFPNLRCLEVLGYTREELAETPLSVLLHPKDRDIVLERHGCRLRDDGPPGVYPCRVITKAGRELWVQLNATPITWEGRPASLDFLRDITKEKRLEAQFLHAQKMEAVGTLAGGVAHDFNNLLTIIIGHARLLLMDFSENDPAREGLEEICRAGERAASLTRQLLAFSRKQVMQPKIVDINDTLKGVHKMVLRLLGENLALHTEPEPGLWPVYIDPGQLDQVIMNLAVNGRDAMPRGGTLSIKTSNTFLDEEDFRRRGLTEVAGPYVLLEVGDTGTGMDERVLGRIFEPFFSTKERGKGTGLGLSTVYGIIKQNGGYIWVESSPGKGSTFSVYLPRSEGVPETSLENGWYGDGVSVDDTVLIVDDDEVLRGIAGKVLERTGYRVLSAGGGREALERAGAHTGTIHLVLTDVVMPGMSGPELLKHLRVSRPDIKVVYMSGYADDAVVRHGGLATGGHFLEKPFPPEVLVRKVREALDEE